MKPFSIKWKSSAKKELKKIVRTEISKILSDIEKLATEPYPTNHKKLLGTEHIYRCKYAYTWPPRRITLGQLRKLNSTSPIL